MAMAVAVAVAVVVAVAVAVADHLVVLNLHEGKEKRAYNYSLAGKA